MQIIKYILTKINMKTTYPFPEQMLKHFESLKKHFLNHPDKK